MKKLLYLFFVLVLLFNFNNSKADDYSLKPSNENCKIIFPSDTPFITPIIEGNIINLGDYSNYSWDGSCDYGYAVGKGTVRLTALGYNIFINGFVYNRFFIDKISVKVTKNQDSNNPIVLQEKELWLYEYHTLHSQDMFDYFIKHNTDNYYQEWYSKYQSQILEQKQAEEQVKLKAQQLVEEKKRIEAQKQQEEQEQIKAQKLHEEQEKQRITKQVEDDKNIPQVHKNEQITKERWWIKIVVGIIFLLFFIIIKKF